MITDEKNKGEHEAELCAVSALRSTDGVDGEREQARNAFRELHAQWLAANHRRDMNEGMDELARCLGLDPLTLKPSTEKDQP